MIDPEHALQLARERAAEIRADGAHQLGAGSPKLDRADDDPPQLLEWALVEPDVRELRSSRALGGLITLLRREIIRLLRPYHAAQLGQQSRFNVQVALQLRRLEERVVELERQVSER